MAVAARRTDEELLALAEQLTGEFRDLPAGSVLHCLSGAVRRARTWGCPPEHLVSTVEASTRWQLAQS
jgi:hypothetical protein